MKYFKLFAILKNNFSICITFLFFLAGCGYNKESGKKEKSAEKGPNVVIFLTDDNAFWYWGFGGGPKLSPTIDEIAEQGVQCTQFYSPSSVCTPSRYNLHTGKYAGRCNHSKFQKAYPDSGAYNILWNTFLDGNKEFTLGEAFQEGGYETAFVGKWHLSPHPFKEYDFNKNDDPADPEVAEKLKSLQQEYIEIVKKSGFDYAASVVPGNNDDGPMEAVHVHNLEWYAKGVIDFLKQRNTTKPFLLIVNITTHHSPCHIESINSPVNLTHMGYVEGLEGIMPARETIFERIQKRGYDVDFKTAGTVWTDDCVAAITKKIKDKGEDENTITIFTTDHNRFDGKATCYQGGVHIPLLIKYEKELTPNSKFNQAMQMIDVFPTLMTACGIKIPVGVRMDGISYWKSLKGLSTETIRNDLYFEFGYTRAILADNFKYIAYRLPENKIQHMKTNKVNKAYSIQGLMRKEVAGLRYPGFYEPDQLYNLANDPNEQVNLANDVAYQEIMEELKIKLKEYLKSFDNTFDLENVDSYMKSEQYKNLCNKARDFDMSTEYWYKKKCF